MEVRKGGDCIERRASARATGPDVVARSSRLRDEPKFAVIAIL
jgi:hypothetical protein